MMCILFICFSPPKENTSIKGKGRGLPFHQSTMTTTLVPRSSVILSYHQPHIRVNIGNFLQKALNTWGKKKKVWEKLKLFFNVFISNDLGKGKRLKKKKGNKRPIQYILESKQPVKNAEEVSSAFSGHQILAF